MAADAISIITAVNLILFIIGLINYLRVYFSFY